MFRRCRSISISSKNEQKLKDFGDKFKINPKNRFNNYTDVLSLNFDIAYVGLKLIQYKHKNLVKNLILNNKNIFIEKPSFLSLFDYEETVSLLKSKKVLFRESMMNFQHRNVTRLFRNW